VFFTIPSIALSQEIPRYDVNSYCKKVANSVGEYSATIEQGCFDSEQNSYNETKIIWGGLPKSMKAYCDKIARYDGSGSYDILKGCIEMESSASSKSKDFKY
jgi:hypothetical protein